IAILDNFCWGNPNLPDRLGALVRTAQGCYDAALAYQTPFISGKDSLNNEYTGADGEKHAIPGTLLISALGIVPDVTQAVTMDLKRAGNFLVAVGATGAELGGSHYALVGGAVQPQHRQAPRPVPDAPRHYRQLHRAMRAGLLQACHDCSEGGLAVTLAEMCLAGGLGAEVKLMSIPRDPYWAYAAPEAILFSQSLGRFVVEVRPDDLPRLDALLADVPHGCIGVVGGPALRLTGPTGDAILDADLDALLRAWQSDVGFGMSDVGKLVDERRPANQTLRNPKSKIQNPKSPRVLVLHANGTNRDRDAALAVRLAGGAPEIVHVNQLLAGSRRLADYGMLVVPGGFSYGDDLGAGVLWSVDLQYRLNEQLARFAENGRPILGICNGFQVLVKAGLLPGLQNPKSDVRNITLTYNQSGRFECRWVRLQPNPASPSLFTQGLDAPIDCPVAHGEGRLAVQDADTLTQLETHNLIPLRYTTYSEIQNPTSEIPYPFNPNGSVRDIAALCNPAGNVMGLMPHPENHVFPWQHPHFHRGGGAGSGLRLFENGIAFARS
ncbi:MAG: phosphoribosylformylglycinamidine synthase I, partial [Anaerolineales bacterium]|nr:phosphoribosylformylglycinamidine synthase I [Anaerolineales bacterium]